MGILKKLNKKYFPNKYLFAPEWIVLGVNNVCNLHCKMCDVGTNNTNTVFANNLIGNTPLNMPIELIKKVYDQIAIHYPKTKIGYAFTEPLVYPQLEESLVYAKNKNIYTTLTTNALALKQKAHSLIEGGLNELYISLDGPQEIHNEIRGHKKSFQKAIEGINEILKYKKRPKISIFCVITEWNIGYLNEFLDFFKDYPLEQIGFMHANFTHQHIADKHNLIWKNSYPATASNVEEVNIDNFDLDVLWDEIKEIKNANYSFNVSFSPKISSKEKLEEYYHKPEVLIGKQCNDIFTNIMIKSNGSVIPAHGRCYNLELGNIYNNNLKEIWNSSILNKFRMDLSNNNGLLPACSRCCSAF